MQIPDLRKTANASVSSESPGTAFRVIGVFNPSLLDTHERDENVNTEVGKEIGSTDGVTRTFADNLRPNVIGEVSGELPDAIFEEEQTT